MIKVEHLDKIYYKGKPNQIHVINDTTLELPDTGLISFLGASGSGKTTLLNTIGGLDKANSGSITYDDLSLVKYSMGKVDEYRSEHFGYVFQNYLLLEDVTVYENLRLALELIGITDAEEVKKRIEYCLKAVGLYKYRKKPAGQLSGGQMQRVSIARALVKKCKVIIADEPTGNLDSENTIEVMNILKKVSKEALVLLVTHNREIAEFYSDRIIELKDGSIIKDGENVSSGSLESQSDRKIHLLDLKNEEKESERVHLHIYSDGSEDLHDLTIVVKNNTIYIDSPSRLQMVQGSSIELVADHYKKLEASMVDDFSYDTSWYDNRKSKNGFAEFFKNIGRSFKYFYTDPKRRKLFNMIFSLIGVILAVLVLVQANYTTIDTSSMCNEPDVYKLTSGTSYSEDYYDSGVSTSIVSEAVEKGYVTDMFGNSGGLSFSVKYTSVRSSSYTVSAKFFPYSLEEKAGLLTGHAPENPSEVVLGKKAADQLLESMGSGMAYKDLIGLSSSDGISITGISNADTNSIYTVRQEYSSYGYYEADCAFGYLKNTSYVLCDGGTVPVSSDEILLNSMYEDVPYLEDKEITYGSKTYKITGYFEGNYDYVFLTLDTALLSKDIDDNYNAIDRSKASDGYNTYYSFRTTDAFTYTLTEGEMPKAANEVLVSAYMGYSVGDTIEDTSAWLGNGVYKITGIYIPDTETYSYFASGSSHTGDARSACLLTKEGAICQYLSESYSIYGLTFTVADSSEAKEFFESNAVVLQSIYDSEYNTALKEYQTSKTVYPIVEAVLLGVILVYTYFSQRAKMISEIYDIGVLRSLGAKRRRMILKNIRDNFAKSTLTTLLGYIITSVVYVIVAARINAVVGSMLLKINIPYILLGVVVLYVTQLFIGSLPLILLLRKTPSEINSKYDI